MPQNPNRTHGLSTPWIAGFLAFGVACGGGDVDEQLVLTGSSTVAPLAMEIAKRFEAEHPGVRIDVQMGGSSRGVADAFTIARDGICVIVHEDNPIQGLTKRRSSVHLHRKDRQLA